MKIFTWFKTNVKELSLVIMGLVIIVLMLDRCNRPPVVASEKVYQDSLAVMNAKIEQLQKERQAFVQQISVLDEKISISVKKDSLLQVKISGYQQKLNQMQHEYEKINSRVDNMPAADVQRYFSTEFGHTDDGAREPASPGDQSQ